MEFYFYHNTETCVGCCACQLACKDHNNLASGEFYRRVRQASFPGEEKARFYSASCNHCERPMCVAACPNGAFYKEADGTVRHDDGKCIGCGKCLGKLIQERFGAGIGVGLEYTPQLLVWIIVRCL